MKQNNRLSTRDELLIGFSECLPRARLDPFCTLSDASILDGARRYIWDLEASSTLWRYFNYFEISLRNAISQTLSEICLREDWWNQQHLFYPNEFDHLQKILLKNEKSFGMQGGKLISELSLGFWVGLNSRRYHQKLWIVGLNRAFPHYQGQRRDLHQSLERLRKLRNRIAHHEPISNRNIAYDIETIHLIAGYLDPRIESWIRSDKSADYLIDRRPT